MGGSRDQEKVGHTIPGLREQPGSSKELKVCPQGPYPWAIDSAELTALQLASSLLSSHAKIWVKRSENRKAWFGCLSTEVTKSRRRKRKERQKGETNTEIFGHIRFGPSVRVARPLWDDLV